MKVTRRIKYRTSRAVKKVKVLFSNGPFDNRAHYMSEPSCTLPFSIKVKDLTYTGRYVHDKNNNLLWMQMR